MSPIQITAVPEAEAKVDEVDIDALLQGKDGKPTLQAEVIDEFLDFVQWDELLDSPEAKEHLESAEIFVKFNEDKTDFEEVDEKTEGAEKLTVTRLAGDVVEQIVDEDDLLAMFEYYLDQLPEETLEDKARKAVFDAIGLSEDELEARGLRLLAEKKGKKKPADDEEDDEEDEEDMEEGQIDERKFKKGDFRKFRKANPATNAPIINRMLGAMLKKQAIQRATGGKGTGYKKGDYDKDPAGYGEGTPTGVKAWRVYRGKKKAVLAKAAKTFKKGRTALAKFLATAKSKKGASAKAKGAKKAAKAIAASADQKPANLSESASMAHKITSMLSPKPLTEDKK